MTTADGSPPSATDGSEHFSSPSDDSERFVTLVQEWAVQEDTWAERTESEET